MRRSLSCLLSAAIAILLAMPSAAWAQREANPGPWGKLQIYETILEPPSAWLWEALYDEYTTWGFAEATIDELAVNLKGLGLSEERIEEITTRTEWSKGTNGLIAYPPDDLVLSLSAEERAALYGYIYKTGLNKSTLTIEGSRFEDLAGRDFDQEVIDLVNSLTYFRGNKALFSDAPVVIKRFDSFERKHAFIKALTRTKGLVVRLQVDESTNLEEVANYWAQGRGEKAVLPLLKSVQRAPGSDSIDILHLLPALPRKYLNTYVRRDDVNFTVYPDCYWTVVNFSKAFPSGAAADFDLAKVYLSEELVEAAPPYRLGDVVVFFEETTDVFVHSAVYIADDIYYTKNGRTPVSPWILMPEDRMMRRYSDRLLYRKVYRTKPGS